jgi:curli production assembly/transport component CsgG
VLKTVHTSKTILSQRVNAGLFRYVNFQRLLEAETGYSYNEPPELCVTEAIEKAVESLIIEGVFDNLWQLKNPGDIDYNPVIRAYTSEKAITQRTDPFGHELHARPKFAVGLSGGGNRYNGDYSFERWEGDYSVSLMAMLHEDAAVRLDAGLFKAATRTRFSADGMYGQLGLEYRPLSALRFSPYLLGGAGAMNITTTLYHHQSNGEVTDLYPYVFAGAGLEVLLVDGFALDLGVTGRYLLDDMMDGANHGEWNDYFWTGRMGLLVFLPI